MSYNGWTNYATWRVMLELFDGQEPRDLGVDSMTTYAAGKCLQQYAEDIIEATSSEGLARDYAFAFLSDVNWYEIAEHILESEEVAENG